MVGFLDQSLHFLSLRHPVTLSPCHAVGCQDAHEHGSRCVVPPHLCRPLHMLTCHVEGGMAGHGEGRLPSSSDLPQQDASPCPGKSIQTASAFWALPCHFKALGLGEVKVS